MSENIKVIGIDCATDVKNTGLSLGLYHKGRIELKETKLGCKSSTIAHIIKGWIKSSDKVLLAIDAPLGWPANLGQALYCHNAGNKISADANNLFRRETDKFIKKNLGKQPLDVGADRIARTALTALNIINELKSLTENSIELAWDRHNLRDISVIEVYPAATLRCYGITSTGYKDKKQEPIRKEMIIKLKDDIIIPEKIKILEENADALDSAVCLLGAKDFIEGNVYYPENISLAKKEGWIWVKRV